MGKFIINDFRGLNSTLAIGALKPGEVAFTQNLRGRPFFNSSKRRGLEPVSSYSDAILGIFDIELDDIIIPLIQDGDHLQFFPPTNSLSVPNNDPYPTNNPLDPNGTRTFLLNVESPMRALEERIKIMDAFFGFTWPNAKFDAQGNAVNIAPGAYPPGGFYQYDLAWNDLKNGNPVGTRAASLVNTIRTAIATLIATSSGVVQYMNTQAGLPEGSASQAVAFDNTTLPLPVSATTGTYMQILNLCNTAIRKLKSVNFGTVGDGKLVFQGGTPTNLNLDRKFSEVSDATCALAESGATTGYGSASYVNSGGFTTIGIREKVSSPPGNITASLQNERGYYYTTTFSSSYTGTVYFYLRADPYVDGLSNSSTIPVTGDAKYHSYQSFSLSSGGGVQTFPVIGEGSAAFTIACPTVAEVIKGWFVTILNSQLIFNPTFINNV